MIALEQCRGCLDDFYNGHNDLGVARCWWAAAGETVKRFRIHRADSPRAPKVYTEVRVPDCYRQTQYAFYAKLPEFVKVSNVVRSKR